MDNSHDSNKPVAWPCVIAEADFEKDTITLEMQCSDYMVRAGQHWLSTSPPASKTLTDEMVVAAARMLSDRQAAECNVDCGDMWKLHGNDFLDDARVALEAAHGIKEKNA